jgi:PAS domain S-box-containing protein
MKTPKPKPDWLNELRLRAEELLGKGKDKDMTNADAFAWVHELQVHQTELEMQNEELKRSRQELEESRNKYLELYEFSPIGYFTLDKQSTILEVNLSGAALLGVERASLAQRRFQLFVETAFRSEFNAFCNRVFESDVKQTCELRLVKNDASLWYAYLEGIAMRNSDVKQCQIAVIDITKQKHAQDEEARLKDQLFHAQNLASVGILAGGVAHNFNNLLMVVMGYATILQMELEKGGPLGEYAQKIIHATQMAGNLSKDLLAFSRKKPVHLQAVNMNTIIKNTEDMLPKLMRENSNCKMTFTEKDCFVMADSDQIMQVLMNLATNARDAMPNGGELEICTDVVEIDDTFVKAHGFGKTGKYVLTSFSDTGMGMDEDTRLRIFEPFFTTKEVGKGTGLGLATVYGIIKQHNGHIDVESKKGIGTTFRIYLPAVTAGNRLKTDVEIAPKAGTETVREALDR